LTKADYVFLLDPWWNPAAEAQAVDRAHRIGQKNKVFTYKFISKDTLEEKILHLQEAKKKLANELIPIEDNFVKSLSKSDIQKLFD
jgi:SNF2 family DNA or RNA helicase